jgi:lysyl-tRNA synthetase, class II
MQRSEREAFDSMREAILFKAHVLSQLRELLAERDFTELVTPVVRRADDEFRPRPVVDMDGRRYLREAIGPALRYNLRYLPRIFEIGPCFRSDASSPSHAPEFMMLDAYAANEDFAFLLDMAEAIAGRFYQGEITRVSVADSLMAAFGVDLVHESETLLRDRATRSMRLPRYLSVYEVVEEFVHRELEPLSRGRGVVLHDYPLGTEVCAKRRPDSAAIVNRFEMIIDGLEVIHGYEDETDSAAFVARSSEIFFYNEEQERIQDGIRDGVIPASSVGLGVGIERLCMTAMGSNDISSFLCSLQF